MATVTHTIRSRYDPADRERLERETGQANDDLWQSLSAHRRSRAPPTFVPATIACDECDDISPHAPPPSVATSSSPAEWYRSLRLTASPSSRADMAAPPPRPSSAPGLSRQDAQPRSERVAKNAWFIRNALLSEPSIKPSLPAPSLADLLARDPPPHPSEGRYVPPVWLHIGPSNRGFGMLQRSGWREGEGLGAHVIREGSRETRERVASDARPLQDIIDLTDSSEDVLGEADFRQSAPASPLSDQASASHMQRSLLTPLPTVLKADRLGIGLKAKTEGPYKQSKKRVTHNAAALAAHVRSAKELHRNKSIFGKGRRGFAKVHKREEDRRKTMLAYLND